MSVCAGCSCGSGVLTCLAHFFLRKGRCAVTGGRVHARATPKGVTVVSRSLQPLGTSRTRADCSLLVRTLCFSAALQSVCQAPACRPHEGSKCGTAALSWRGAVCQPVDRDSAVYQCQVYFLRGTAASPKVHHVARGDASQRTPSTCLSLSARMLVCRSVVVVRVRPNGDPLRRANGATCYG